jgi:altronate dehydratase
MPAAHSFPDVARFPLPGDNAAIATRRLEAGDTIRIEDRTLSLNYTVQEGHRFAAVPIPEGEPMLSWRLPFGHALRTIEAGEYVCNQVTIDAFAHRNVDFEFPANPNFAEEIVPYRFDEATFQPTEPTERCEDKLCFEGYRRSPARGVGVRNRIVIMGVTSRSASYAKQLEDRLQDLVADYPNIDGVAALAHSEGSGREPHHNREFLLRALAALFVHPNVAAVLAVDYGVDPVTSGMLEEYLEKHQYPYRELPYRFLTLTGHFAKDLRVGEETVLGWLPEVNATSRTPQSVEHLNIALQCGGSDAFSGVTGNPLAASVAREIVKRGGSANLGEADELVGAESYMVSHVRDIDTARQFLTYIEDFKALLGWHGATAESNPSGGNRLRGLYNIILKSIGAAMKKSPDVRLDFVVDYAERIREPGYYFVNSPGHDVEGLAGQVATGSNLIFFITGNGSVTNFPFVPTIKYITTTRRHELLKNEMDINAGALIDGRSMEDLTRETLEYTLEVASGKPCLGEKAGHSQISIWRNWRQTDDSQVESLLAMKEPNGVPISIAGEEPPPALSQFSSLHTERGFAADQVALVMPTSLCSSQIARMSAFRLNKKGLGLGRHVNRYVSLVHTEGCAVAGRDGEGLYHRTLINYMTHPLVRFSLFLEHGCEKTHNEFLQKKLEEEGENPDRFGWASVQLDGGIRNVLERIDGWFEQAMESAAEPEREETGLEHLRVGLMLADPIPESLSQPLGRVIRMILGGQGTVVVPATFGFRSADGLREDLHIPESTEPSLAYGETPGLAGFHLMEMPTEHVVEALTGLGAGGVDLILMIVEDKPAQGHPLVPTLQLTVPRDFDAGPLDDFDLVLGGDRSRWTEQILGLLLRTASRKYQPKLFTQGNIDFQITRGLLGVSL